MFKNVLSRMIILVNKPKYLIYLMNTRKFNNLFKKKPSIEIRCLFKNIETYIIHMERYSYCISKNTIIINPASYNDARNVSITDFFITNDNRYNVDDGLELSRLLISSKIFMSQYEQMLKDDVNMGISGKNRMLSKTLYDDFVNLLLQLKEVEKKL